MALSCVAYSFYRFKKPLMMSSPAEAQFSDKHLAGVLEKIDLGIKNLQRENPGMKKPFLKSGLRGPRYYIELGIEGQNVDAYKFILCTERLIQKAAKTMSAKIISTDSYSQGDTSSYMIDYQVESTMNPGTHSKGTVYIRGVKTPQGYDQYRFVLEKGVDFSQLDADLMLAAIEEMVRQLPPVVEQPKEASRF